MVDKINFITIGAHKCGTTWLYENLNKHPEIQIGCKEWYDVNNYHKEIGYFIYDNLNVNIYHKYFDFTNLNVKIYGEICPEYCYAKLAPKNIFKYNPNIKLIYILRNPINQIMSMYKMNLNNNTINKYQDDIGFYLMNINYVEHIKKYLKYFKSSQFKIMFFDGLSDNSLNFLQDIYKWLNVDYNYIPINYNQLVNVNKYNKKDYIIKNEILNKYNKYINKTIIELEKYLNIDLNTWKIN